MNPGRSLLDRKAQTANANASTANRFRQRVEAYRALTRDQNVPVKVACQRLKISADTALRYEQQITGTTAAERRRLRMERYAQLRNQGLTQAQAAREIGMSQSTCLNYDRALAGVPAPDLSPRKGDLMAQHRLGAAVHAQDTDLTDWDWIDFAYCRDKGTELFIGGDNENSVDRQVREVEAIRICMDCPVRAECLDRALKCRESGVWGGTTDEDRVQIRRRLTQKSRAAA